MTENATVTTRSPDGTEETQECQPNSYVLVLGPRMELAHEQVYSNGTHILTIKRIVR